MPEIKPHIIVPNLIEQPTWGGDYISTLKNISDPDISQLILGQSYELYEHTNLSSKTSTEYQPSLELADSADPALTQPTVHNDTIININQLIQLDPLKILGSKALKKCGPKIDTLIKLTQGRGNSYQLHVKKPVGKWLPKPESWYYFEPGLISLGLNPQTDISAYQNACHLIQEEARILSNQITQQKLTLAQGQSKLQTLIDKLNPTQYVNILQVAKDSAIDLSSCGIHHSWEENSQTHPQGNILYEVQQNVYDPVSTIRSFDKGKIKNDGSVRDLQIDDYFTHIDTSPKANDPQTHFTDRLVLKKTSTHTIRQIFDTTHYQLQELTFTKTVSNNFTTTSDSLHHLFVRSGHLKLKMGSQTWIITQGYSVFIPANTGRYSLSPHRSHHVRVLKTFI